MALNLSTKVLKTMIDERLSTEYKQVVIKSQPFYSNSDGLCFHVIDLGSFEPALVIEYAGTWEDGDLFYPEDYDTIDEMYAEMIAEIEQA